MLKCVKCSSELETQGLLDAHMKSHEMKQLLCEQCNEAFTKQVDLDKHTDGIHKNNHEWNCDSCPFQAYTANELMKHLKETSHQPSKNIANRRLLYNDYKKCYTCKLEFEGHWNLMNHRKILHPSNKKCFLFADGSCTRGNECWYVHEELLMEVDESFNSDNAEYCGG